MSAPDRVTRTPASPCLTKVWSGHPPQTLLVLSSRLFLLRLSISVCRYTYIFISDSYQFFAEELSITFPAPCCLFISFSECLRMCVFILHILCALFLSLYKLMYFFSCGFTTYLYVYTDCRCLFCLLSDCIFFSFY